MAKSKQDKMNALLIEAFEEFERTLPKQRKSVLASMSNSRLKLADTLSAQTGDDGRIQQSKNSLVVKRISEVERQIVRTYEGALRKELEQTVRVSSESVVNAFIAALGPHAIATLVGASSAIAVSELVKTGAITGIVFALIFGLSVGAFVKTIVDSILSRRGPDGKTTRQRIQLFAKEMTTDISRVVRKSLSEGNTIADILRQIERVYTDADWRVTRLVETESMTAYRTSVARMAEESEQMSAVQIVDFPEGHENTHNRHTCYKYATTDEYGLGVGVYPATVRKIRNPHPQCRSILVPVLAEGIE